MGIWMTVFLTLPRPRYSLSRIPSGGSTDHLLHLLVCLVQSVSVKFIPETQGPYNDTGTGLRDGDLVAKLALFMFFAFTNTSYIHFMQGVNFILVVLLLN